MILWILLIWAALLLINALCLILYADWWIRRYGARYQSRAEAREHMRFYRGYRLLFLATLAVAAPISLPVLVVRVARRRAAERRHSPWDAQGMLTYADLYARLEEARAHATEKE